MIAVALAFPAALGLFLLLMAWLEDALFPGTRAQIVPTRRPERSPDPVPLENRP